MILTLVQLFVSPGKLFWYGEASYKHSWYGEAFLLSTPGTVVRSRGFQFSGWRSQVGSRNPRKIGMGMPNILGFVVRGCRKMGVGDTSTPAQRSQTFSVAELSIPP